jgi:hypothetical protein
MKILIRSFNPQTLKKATEQIIEMRKFSTNVFVSKQSVIGFPTTTKKWTLLRSPHVDKKSREQFQMKNCCVSYNTTFGNQKELTLFFQKLKHTEIYGTEFSVEISHSSFCNKFI